MKDAETLLKLLTERLPPHDDGAHGLVFRHGRLQVSLRLSQFVTFFLDEADYGRTIDAIVADIERLLPAEFMAPAT